MRGQKEKVPKKKNPPTRIPAPFGWHADATVALVMVGVVRHVKGIEDVPFCFCLSYTIVFL